MKKQTFFKGIAVLVFGSLIAKALGAVYRVPLTWILGAEGLGVYQLVFPVFSLILVLSSTAFPTAISKLIAEEKNFANQKLILKTSLTTLSLIGLFFGVLLFSLSGVIANIQGNAMATLPYMAIAPSVLFVSVISVFRGYFQGKMNMTPTSVSNIFEQFFKLIFGLCLAFLFVPQGLEYGVLGAVLGVTLSEVVTLIYITATYFMAKEKNEINTKSTLIKKEVIQKLFKTSIPIVFANIIIPLSILLDSMLVVNLLTSSGFENSQSTILWGIESGVVMSVINLPVVLTLQIATCIVPSLVLNLEGSKKRIKDATIISFAISMPCVFGIAVLAPQVLNALYAGSLSIGDINEFQVATNLLVFSAPLIFLTSILQLQNASLQGLNHLKVPAINMFIGLIIKLIVVISLVQIPQINIFGVTAAKYSFFLTAVLLNFMFMLKKKYLLSVKKEFFVSAMSAVSMALALLVFKNFELNLSVYILLPLEIFIGIIVFAFSYICLMPNKNYLKLIKFKKQGL